MWGGKYRMYHASPFFGRGAIKFVILNLLKKEAKHGYEIMKDIEETVGGFYAASPGSVYPTLQMLEDQGYVNSTEKDGKRIYRITEEGEKYLEENKEVLEHIQERFQRAFGGKFSSDQREILREFRDMVHALAHEVRKGSDQPEKWEKIRDVLARARREIDDILSK